MSQSTYADPNYLTQNFTGDGRQNFIADGSSPNLRPSIMGGLNGLLHGYRNLMASQFNFLRIKAREDAQDLVKKNLYFLSAVLLSMFTWFGLMSWVVAMLSDVMGFAKAILLVSSVHLLAAGGCFYAGKRTKLFSALAISEAQSETLIDRLDADTEREEGIRTVNAMKASEYQVEKAKADLEVAVREKLDPRRVIRANAAAALSVAFLFGIVAGAKAGRHRSH